MKLTKHKLKKLIKEELSIMTEGLKDDIAADQASRGYTPQPSNIPSGFTSSKDYYDTLGSPDPQDIQILQALKELLDASDGNSTFRWTAHGLAKELRRLADVADKNPGFDTEEPETSDEDAFELPTATGASHHRMRQVARRRGEEF